MPKIHPSSHVDHRAELASDVQVGPGCVVEGRVKLGDGCRLMGNIYLRGPLEVGQGNTFYPFCCIGFEPQDLGFDIEKAGAGTSIGDRNTFRESVTVHRATGSQPTTIGAGNFFMANSHVAHDSLVGNDCVLANGALLAGHVTLEDNVILGGNAGVHQFCRMGRLSMLAGIRAINKDLPPFFMCYQLEGVASLNVVGLRRAGLRQHIQPLTEAYTILYRRKLPKSTAIDMIEKTLGDDPLCLELVKFCRASARGFEECDRLD